MPATNLSKITFKNPQASQEFEGQALKHEGSCVVQLQFCHQLVWIIWILQTPPCISISLPAWRCEGFVILQQHLRNTRSCSSAEVNTQSQQIPAPDIEAVDLCQNLKQPDCFFFLDLIFSRFRKIIPGVWQGTRMQKTIS